MKINLMVLCLFCTISNEHKSMNTKNTFMKSVRKL